jgi:hypothetical protein
MQQQPQLGINLLDEKLVSFREAASHCPRRRRGRKPHTSTFYRWRDQGLETIQVGGQLCTSLEALQRFFASLTKTHPPEHPITHTPRQRRHLRSVDQELAKLGLD